MSSRDELRRVARDRRAAIPDDRRAAQARAAGETLLHHTPGMHTGDVALYRRAGAELDPAPLATAIRRLGGTTWYPDTVDERLEFRAWDGEGEPEVGRFGIEVPPPGSALDPGHLTLVVVPVVAFDRVGGRLGMGAGFYDRTFAFRRGTPPPPLLVGLAFDEQAVDVIDAEEWDVPLDAVATPTGWIDCRREPTRSPTG